MKILKVLGIALMVLAVVALISSVGAFTAVELDRGVDVSVVNDRSALLGIDIPGRVGAGDGSVLVTITNNGEKSKLVTISLTDGTDPGVSLVDPQKRIKPGKTKNFRVNIDRQKRPRQIEFRVTAQDGAVVSLTRSAQVAPIRGPCTGDRLVVKSDRNGRIRTDKVVEVKPGVTVRGGISGARCVILGEDVSVNGNIRNIENNVTARESVVIRGNIQDIGGPVTIGEEGLVDGGIQNVGATVKIGSEATVRGNIQKINGDLILAEGASVEGNIQKISGEIIRKGEGDDGGEGEEDDIHGPGMYFGILVFTSILNQTRY